MAHTQKKNKKKVADTLISKSVSFVGSFFLLLLFTVFLCVLFSAFFFFIPYLRCFFFFLSVLAPLPRIRGYFFCTYTALLFRIFFFIPLLSYTNYSKQYASY